MTTRGTCAGWLAGCLLLSACSPGQQAPQSASAPKVELARLASEKPTFLAVTVVDPDTIARNGTIRFSVRSGVDADVYFHCSLEQRFPGAWEEVAEGINGKHRGAKAALRLDVLEAGQAALLETPSLASMGIPGGTGADFRITCRGSLDVDEIVPAYVATSTPPFRIPR